MNARALTTAACAALALALVVPPTATGDEASSPCETFDVKYAVVGALRLQHTPLGAADGVYSLGTGALKLRFSGAAGGPRSARMLSYELDNYFSVRAKSALFPTTVTTQSRTTVLSAPCGAAKAVLDGSTLSWSSKVIGYRSDGTVTCDGAMCGKFGAPPPGVSALHDGPFDVAFSPFVFGEGGHTFTMAYSLVEKTSGRTASLALAGREASRTCAAPPAGCD